MIHQKTGQRTRKGWSISRILWLEIVGISSYFMYTNSSLNILFLLDCTLFWIRADLLIADPESQQKVEVRICQLLVTPKSLNPRTCFSTKHMFLRYSDYWKQLSSLCLAWCRTNIRGALEQIFKNAKEYNAKEYIAKEYNAKWMSSIPGVVHSAVLDSSTSAWLCCHSSNFEHSEHLF